MLKTRRQTNSSYLQVCRETRKTTQFFLSLVAGPQATLIIVCSLS